MVLDKKKVYDPCQEKLAHLVVSLDVASLTDDGRYAHTLNRLCFIPINRYYYIINISDTNKYSKYFLPLTMEIPSIQIKTGLSLITNGGAEKIFQTPYYSSEL